jgi:fibronectin-binding autotransporter adhesin
MFGLHQSRRIMALGAAAVLLFAGLAGAGHAATRTWVGGFGPDWSTAGNWGASGLPVAGDTVFFPNPATSNANLAGNPALAAIVLGPNSGGSVITGAVTINASILTLDIDDQSTSATPSEINATIAITGASMFVKSGNAAHTLYLSKAISGSQAVRIYGPGAVEFASATSNSYTGATTVASADGNGGAGRLQLSGFATSLVPADLIIGGTGSGAPNTAQVKLTALFAGLINDASKVTIAADGLLDMGSLSETIAQLSGTGNVTMSGSNILTVGGDNGTFTWGGVISGTGNVNKVGTGSMTYTGKNSYTGLTTVSRGTLVLNAPLVGGSGRAINGPLSIGLGVGAVTTATVQLANSVQIFSTTVPITINSDGQLDTGVFRQDVGPTTINGGKFAIGGNVQQFGGLTMTGGTISGAGTLVLRASNVEATSTLALGASTINLTVELDSATDTITVNGGSTQPELTINGAVTSGSPGGSPGNLVKTGTGTLRLAGNTANAYGGSTTIERGVLELAKPANVVAITGPIVIGNSTDAAGSAVLKNLADFQIGGAPVMTINASGVYEINANAQASRQEVIGGLSGNGSLVMNANPKLFIDVATGAAHNFTGVITSPNATFGTSINKRAAGEQALSGSSASYSGNLNAFDGVLRINGDIRNAAAAVASNGGTISGTGRIGGLFTGSPAGIFRPGSNGGTLTTTNVVFGGNSSANATLLIDLVSAGVGGFGKINAVGSVNVSPNSVPTPLQLVAAPGFTAPIGTVFEIVTNDGTDAVVGTFAGLPQGATVSAGSTRFTISYVGGTGNDITLTVRNTLDIDGDGTYNAATDGLLISRYLNNLIGPALIAGAVAPAAPAGTATRTNATDILNHLTVIRSTLNVKGSGTPDSTDSLLIMRYLFGFRGTALVAGVTLPGGETATTVAARIAALTP